MSTHSTPLVSVIMPVFNRKQDLPGAIDSILNQAVRDLEMIIVDDGSTDGSTQVTEEYAKKDRRILLQPHTQNQGLVAALNDGLKLAQGRFIARMDQDDFSVPDRLQKQVEYLDAHSDVGICGGWMEIIGESGGLWEYPASHDAIYARMLFTTAMGHPTVMMRSEALRAHDLWYDAHAPHAEDYDLWSRALPLIRFANIQEVLVRYRLHPTNTYRVYGDIQHSTRIMVYRRLLSRFGFEPSIADLLVHERITSNATEENADFLNQAREWLERLSASNRQLGIILPSVLDEELGKRWTRICTGSRKSPYRTALQILQSPLRYKNARGIEKFIRTLSFLFRKIIKNEFTRPQSESKDTPR